MGEFLISAALFLQVTASLGTHVLLGTLGGILTEKVGNTCLGIEGMMLLGASTGFLVAYNTGNALLAVLASGAAGALGALIYAIITVSLRGNQVVTGLALTTFGSGAAGLIGMSISGKSLPDSINAVLGIHKTPVLSDIPLVGKMLFEQSPFVLGAIITAVIIYIYFKKTNIGLNARVVGESPAAADASGINVTLHKYVHTVLGGFLCGVGGGYYSMVYVGRWQIDLTAGAGWISVALIIFAMWNPLRAILGAYLFGAVRGLTFKLQGGLVLFGQTITFSAQLLDMAPYIVTVLVLLFITMRNKREYQAPASLGTPYFRENR
ncbi:MAG: ABC transporter permease [Oscillospiraceae bacterium]|nr:ABC transporter permease [Oscillospiraceae bacterium]MBQ3224881.1 ABC transporter permease [Oscillospiraceae bacterium]MBQ6698283.1 ABC transporter permease [Oscillospiraceae bacterium]MBQ7054877.1 ABC transporter permease [Oscillospiraceae bacterium]